MANEQQKEKERIEMMQEKRLSEVRNTLKTKCDQMERQRGNQSTESIDLQYLIKNEERLMKNLGRLCIIEKFLLKN